MMPLWNAWVWWLCGGLLVAIVATGVAVWLCSRLGWMAPNYLGQTLPAAVGLAFPLAATAGLLARSAFAELGFWEYYCWLVFAAAVYFGALGLADDLAGPSDVKGLAGHFRALVRGRFTTGAIKAVFGIPGALAIAWLCWHGPSWRAVVAGAVIALGANVVNLLDKRPGRALKGAFAGYALALVGGYLTVRGPEGFWAGWPVLAAALVLFPYDAGRAVMMGDVGANSLGAAVGLSLTLTLPPVAQAGLALGLLALNLYADRRSLSEIIEGRAMLRWLDGLGVARPEGELAQ